MGFIAQKNVITLYDRQMLKTFPLYETQIFAPNYV